MDANITPVFNSEQGLTISSTHMYIHTLFMFIHKSFIVIKPLSLKRRCNEDITDIYMASYTVLLQYINTIKC